MTSAPPSTDALGLTVTVALIDAPTDGDRELASWLAG